MKRNAHSRVAVIATILLTTNVIWLCPVALAEDQTIVRFAPQGIATNGSYLVLTPEYIGLLELLVERVGVVTGTDRVRFEVRGDTATAGLDYSTITGEVTFLPGQSTAILPLRILEDGLAEDTEYLDVVLLSVTGEAVLGDPDWIRVGILDAGVAVRFNSPPVITVSESENWIALVVEVSDVPREPVSVDYSTRDGTATAGLDYVAVSGTLGFDRQYRSQTIVISLLNDGLREPTEEFLVTLDRIQGGAFRGSPDSVTIRILDNDVGVGFAEGRYEVQEFEPAVTLTVIRGGDDQEPFRVDYATADSTARSGQDYVGTAGTLEFGRGENSKTITIQILNDSLTEGVESFFVRLTNPTGNRNLGQANTVVQIVDDDPGVGFADDDVWVVESQPSVTLRVFRGSDDLASFTVDYETRNGTAHAGFDYVAAAGTLEFGEGETTKLITIALLNDALREGTEQFSVTLSNPSDGRSLGRATVRVRIEDDDPGVGFISNEMWVNENQGRVGLVVVRGSDRPGAFTVHYATVNGTAQAGLDYVATSGTLEFSEDETSKTLEIELINDEAMEPEETFSVRLRNPSAGHALDPQRSTVTVRIQDNDRGVGFSPAWYSVREDAGRVELRVVRETDYAGAFRVNYTTRATGHGWMALASSGIDYVPGSGVLEFAEGENVKMIEVEIVNDALWEPDEEFQVVLSDLTGLVGLFEPVATVVIYDNDPGVHFDPREVQVSETESSAVLTVHRGADSVEAFTVDYTARHIETAAQRRIPPLDGTLTFGPGQMTQILTIPLMGDDKIWQGDDEVEVRLTRPTGVGFLDHERSVGRVVIVDDEPFVWEAHRVGEPFPEVSDVRAVTWGGGRYVAVGGEWALTSVDAREWATQRVEGFQAWDVIWADGQFVAVGDDGVWRAPDGLNWTKGTAGPQQSLFRVSHGDGLHVVLDRDGRVWMTPDLEAWSWAQLGSNLRDVTWGDAGFVVVGDDGRAWHGRKEGVWEALGRIAPNWLGAVAWGEEGYVTATSQYDEVTQSERLLVLHSLDGRNWETNRLEVAVWTPDHLVYGDGAYVGVNWSQALRLRWDSDRWVVNRSSGLSSYWFGMGDVAYGNAGYVSTGFSTVSVSEDGLVWERLHRPNLTRVHSAEGTLFVEHVQGDRRHWSYYEIHSSTDARTWTLERSGGFGGGSGSGLVSLNGVMADLRGGTLHLRHQDGSWNVVTFQDEGWRHDVAAGSDCWVVVGDYWDPVTGHGRPMAYRSEDGEKWESYWMGFHGGIGRVKHAGEWFYAMGHEDGIGEVILQSRDGAVWQRSSLSRQYELYAVAHGKGMYVAAARSHNQDRRVLLRSEDGVNWDVARVLDLTDFWSADVGYGSGLFVVTWRGWWDGPQVISYLSLDGLEWRRHTPLPGEAITAMAYADGRIVAVGAAGLVLRSQPLVYLGEPRLEKLGRITVRFEGEAGREYAVEGSADLEYWTAVGTVRPSLSVQEIALPVEQEGWRFYRLRGLE